MTLAVLAVLALAVMLLPMLPALFEWHRPTDVAPLGIDSADALDPAFLAHRFAARLATALPGGDKQLGRSDLVSLWGAAATTAWPLRPDERSQRSSQRVWHLDGDAELPTDISFMAEVAASGSLATARKGLYCALWAGQRLSIAEDSIVLRWAHAPELEAAPGCLLAGRTTADREIVVHERVRFSRLHAPTVRFVAGDSVPAPAAAASSVEALPSGLDDDAALVWDDGLRRGFADAALDIGRHRAWRGDLVCRGRLRIGRGCRTRGSLKAHGELLLARGCSIGGSVVAVGAVRLGDGCRVRGSVVSETAVVLGPGCVIGTPDQPATVTAPRIRVACGVGVHGTLWAAVAGRSVDAAAAAAATAATRDADEPGLATAAASARVAA